MLSRYWPLLALGIRTPRLELRLPDDDELTELGEVHTGSWLGVEYQGFGYGTEMRLAVLNLAFAELGAEYALTASFVDNAASIGVSRKLGYQPDGVQRDVCEGSVLVTQRFRMSRDDWQDRERPEIAVAGAEACLELFGARPGPGLGRVPGMMDE